MSSTLLSPGVESRETSVQSTIVRNATGRAALAGKFAWGPAFQVVQITNEVELVDTFGGPNNDTADYFISAMNFLQYGNDLRVVRAVDKENAKNASPLFGQIKSKIVSGGSNYTVGDKVVVKYNNKAIEEDGIVTQVASDTKKIEKIFIPSAKIIAHSKAIGTYPQLGAGWTAEVSKSTSGVAGSITLDSIITDSGILLTESDSANSIITSEEYMEQIKTYSLPAIAAIYPGERGSNIEVEIISKESYEKNTTLNQYPGGGEKQTSGPLVFQYGPQNEDQYGIIVRVDGVIQESMILSVKRGDKDVYGSNIFMDDYFSKGSSKFIYASSMNWPKGFSGFIKLGGGVSSNKTVSAGDLMQAWDHFADRESLHVNLLIAGSCAGESEEIASTVQKHVISIADERQDCLALVSPPRELVVNVPLAKAVSNITSWRKGRSSSGEALDNNMNVNSTYFEIDGNYKYQYDKYNDVNRWVPLAADIAGLCARTDSVAQPWASPAGYNRGQIMNCIKLAIEPRQSHRDELYQLGINPVAGFAGGDGFILFGDKTGALSPTPFDHINVRRLFNMLKKNIGDSAKYKLFEINDDFTRKSFRMEVSQYLSGLKSLGAMYDFRVVCDTTNNTPAVIDRGEFVASIYIKPARSINYITLNFIATNTGADFDELIGPQQ